MKEDQFVALIYNYSFNKVQYVLLKHHFKTLIKDNMCSKPNINTKIKREMHEFSFSNFGLVILIVHTTVLHCVKNHQ